MADQLQLRGGTTTEHSTFTGALKEVTVDTTKKTIVVHDNSTVGGIPLAKENLSNVPAGTITSSMIADGTIATADIADGAVTSAKIADGTIVNADINASAAIDLSKLANGALPNGITVASANITDLSVATADIADGAVTSAKIADGTIVNADVSATAAIALSKLATGALPTAITVNSSNIEDLSIATGDLADGAVTSAKIADGTIINGDINSNAAIDLGKLAVGALPTAITVASANIVDGSIVNADVNAAAAIAGTKVSPDFGSQNVTTTGTTTSASFIPGSSTVPSNGVYLPAANSVGVSTNSTERLRITSTGVGIGTTPSAELHISRPTAGRVITRLADPDGRTTELRSPDNAGNTAGVGTTTNHPFVFFQNNTEAARIDDSKRLLVGTSSTRSWSGVTSQIQLEGTNYNASSISQTLNSNDGTGVYLALNKSRGTSNGSHTIVQNGDEVGTIYFNAADGSVFRQLARINAHVDGTPGDSDMPGRLSFHTTADGAPSPTERARINNAGEFSFRNTSYVYPATDNAVSLGLTGFRFSAVWAANGTIQTSDERSKADIADATLGSEFIKALRPVSYKWLEGGKRDTGERDEDNNYIYESVPGTRTHWGFIAQEVKEAVDEAGVDFGGWVLTDKDDPDSQQALRYDQFIAPLTKALQEALAEIDVLKAKVAALEAQ